MAPATFVMLSDDHIDLLVTACMRWRVLTSATAAAFSPPGDHLLVAGATEAGRLLREQNTAAMHWLSQRGRTRLRERTLPEPYTHRAVERLDPVEVIKAAHAAQSCCAASPTWQASAARRLTGAVITAATHRLDGYSAAPWSWTRPHRRRGRPLGIGTSWRPQVPGLDWVAPDEVRERWLEAALVVVTAAAAASLPADLPPRSGVFVLAGDEHPDEVWQALTSLNLPALVLFWPTCGLWLLSQLSDPAAEFVEHRDLP